MADEVKNEQQNNMPESIWADGVPKNLKEEDKLTTKEIFKMAVNFITKNVLLEKGVMIENGFPREDFPNIVCKRDGITYAIVVLPSIYPNYSFPTDEFRLQLVELCKKMNTTPLFAPVGYQSVDEARAKESLMLKGDVFKTQFPGFVYLTDEEKQDPKISVDKLFRPE